MSLPDNYVGLSPLYCGRAAPPSGLPLWAQGAPLNAWIPIPNTNQTISATNWAGPYGKPTNGGSQVWFSAWGAMCLLPTGEIIVAAQGGHTDGEDNRVASLNLLSDVPGWVTRTPPSLIYRNSSHAGEVDQPYNWDQTTSPYNFKPSAVHGYQNSFWCASINRVLRVGCLYPSYSGNANFPTTDGWNPATNTWDAPGTYPYAIFTGQTYAGPTANVWPTNTAAGVSLIVGTLQDVSGNIWSMFGGAWRYSPTANTYSQALTSNTVANPPRAPWAASPALGLTFGLCFGDGQGSGPSLGVCAAKLVGTALSPITFNGSAALTQFTADKPEYGGMDYDPVRGTFLFYEGRRTYTANPSDTARVGRIYEITPNTGSVWDMSIFTYSGGATPPPETANAGMNNRFKYVSALKGFVMLPAVTNNAYFMRTS